MKYDVHIFATVFVLVPDVEADSHAGAIKKAEERVDWYDHGDIKWDEGTKEFLVDEVGDTEFERSCWYDADCLDQKVALLVAAKEKGREVGLTEEGD